VNIESILSLDRTYANIQVSSKKRALEEVARLIALSNVELDPEEIFKSLIAREKLGTTAIGEGIAIPHCRLDGCTEIIGALFSLREPIDFQAFDDKPVNVLFVILVPPEEVDDHLQALGLLASRFELPHYRQAVSCAADDQTLFACAIAPPVDNVTAAKGYS
jgi:PTS system nitrogen regulatory IIA component